MYKTVYINTIDKRLTLIELGDLYLDQDSGIIYNSIEEAMVNTLINSNRVEENKIEKPYLLTGVSC